MQSAFRFIEGLINIICAAFPPERSYLSQSPARVKHNVLCRTQMQDMRKPGEVGRVLRLLFSRRHLLVIISNTNYKYLYFI